MKKTYLQAFEEAKTWKDKIHVINIFHLSRIYSDTGPEWNLSKTALYFSISISHVSEDILLAKRYDLIKHCSTRKEALGILRKINELSKVS